MPRTDPDDQPTPAPSRSARKKRAKGPPTRSAYRMMQVWILVAHWQQVRSLAATNDETASDFVRRAVRREIARTRQKHGLDDKGRAKVSIRE